jgi:ABC-type Mn2+/Zn2+ transport system permease subunit
MNGVSIAVAVISTTGGLILSYYADLASGAVIVTLAAFIFFIAVGVGCLRQKPR